MTFTNHRCDFTHKSLIKYKVFVLSQSGTMDTLDSIHTFTARDYLSRLKFSPLFSNWQKKIVTAVIINLGKWISKSCLLFSGTQDTFAVLLYTYIHSLQYWHENLDNCWLDK